MECDVLNGQNSIYNSDTPLQVANRSALDIGHAITCLRGIANARGFDAVAPDRTRECLVWLAIKMEGSFEALTDALERLEGAAD